jgi:hypothetical protein
MIAVVDVDDLWCEEQITTHLLPLKEAVPDFAVTSYSIPNRLGPVHELKTRYPWITFGIHGFEHSFCECLEWTPEKATVLIKLALEMGYAPLFKPPNWSYDVELLKVLPVLGVALHHHKDAPPPSEWPGQRYGGSRGNHTYLHTHIEQNPATDFIGDHRDFRPIRLLRFKRFATPLDFASAQDGNS